MKTRYGDIDISLDKFLSSMLLDAQEHMIILKGFSRVLDIYTRAKPLEEAKVQNLVPDFVNAVAELEKLLEEIRDFMAQTNE